MALVIGLSHLLVVFLLLVLSVAWGSRVLELLGCRADEPLEEIVFASGLFFAVLQILVFGLIAVGGLRRGVLLVLLALLALSAGRGWWRLTHLLRELWWGRAATHVAKTVLGVLAAAVLALEAMLTMAPLSGSDAMQYHFTVPLLWGHGPLRPIFWLTNSFLTGQAHLLISLGLALGSDRVALGLIFLGGGLTAGALFIVAKKLSSSWWALLAVLTFVATPLVFWQISISGSPDIWMAFFVLLAVLAADRGAQPGGWRWLVLAGFFAGAAAGVKYTGWIVPFALAVYILAAKRSWKWAALSVLASVAAGVWPLARNVAFTGDPFFPFLTRWVAPNRVNSYALAALLGDVRAPGFSLGLARLFTFPVLMVLKGNDYGLGQFYGPVVLAFAPLLVFAAWKHRVARIAGMLWAVLFLSDLFSSQEGRYLLPAYPLGLALSFSGFAGLATPRRRWGRAAGWVTLLFFLGFAIVSDVFYARSFLPVAVGREGREAFLERMVPDYQTVAFINHTLEAEHSRDGNARVMVFFRQLYYLRVSFVVGDPANSWLMDPRSVNDSAKLLESLQKLDVKWVVRWGPYPLALAEGFNKLETEGHLVPVSCSDVETLTGISRIYDQRIRGAVVILKVVN